MNQRQLQEKVITLETELEIIKGQLQGKSPDFSIDERNWKKLKPLSKTVRGKLFRERYGKKTGLH